MKNKKFNIEKFMKGDLLITFNSKEEFDDFKQIVNPIVCMNVEYAKRDSQNVVEYQVGYGCEYGILTRVIISSTETREVCKWSEYKDFTKSLDDMGNDDTEMEYVIDEIIMKQLDDKDSKLYKKLHAVINEIIKES